MNSGRDRNNNETHLPYRVKIAGRRPKPRAIAVILLACAASRLPSGAAQQPYTSWRDYLGSSDSAQYSALRQISKSNVSQLQLAWFYPADSKTAEFGFNPIVSDGIMYVLGKDSAITALDAATGREIWVHAVNTTLIAHRGINYWASPNHEDRRILFQADNYLQALNARTGQIIPSFGQNGRVDLRVGLSRDPKTVNLIQSFSPGRLFENLIILGSATGEEYGAPPGDVRAYDVRNGKMVWIFHTVPHPGESGYETWPKQAWTFSGGTNCWGEMSVDEQRGIIYIPTGAPTYDFYGADRKGTNLFSDSLLALDARSGKYLWHFQLVHHDLWDYDAAAAPKLMTILHDGRSVDVAALPTKQGFLFVFDRVTGKPIWPVEERPVPKSDVPGEEAWPTQPFPTAPPPFARQKFTAEDIDPYILDPAERTKWRDILLNARNDGIFTPPGFRDTIQMPGNSGGANWGAAAIDPTSGTLYVESKDAPTILKLERKPPKVPLEQFGSPEQQGHIVYFQNCQICHGSERTGAPPAIPSLVNAINAFGAEHIKQIVRVGAPPMPSFSSLSEAEVGALLAFLKHPEAGQLSEERVAWLATESPSTWNVDPSETRYYSGYGYTVTADGLSVIGPPWSTLTAYDLNQGTIKWQVPLGEVSKLAAQGIKNTGSYWPRGGIVVTAGGLIFAGTRSDRKIRAYDKDTGQVIWERELPARPDGVPSVFEVGKQEYVAISARNLEKSSTEPATAEKSSSSSAAVQGYYVFALPEGKGQPDSN